MKYVVSIFVFFLISIHLHAGSIDTVSVYSNSMQKSIKTVVIKPDAYHSSEKRYPVVYLLHGYGGDFSNWIKRVPELKDHADRYQLIIVCPDGNYGSWYFDSPVDSTYRYETHISTEVVNYIDMHFRTVADKSQRAITGLSMGGHGALFIGLRHAEIFGAAGSMSGGVDLTESKHKYDIIKRIGDTVLYAKEWHDLTVINLIEKYTATGLKIIIDCGDKDIFIAGNRKLHQKLKQLKIAHEFTERPGQHNWAYWRNSIPFHLLYFQRFFSQP